jgi:hypothetical protein
MERGTDCCRLRPSAFVLALVGCFAAAAVGTSAAEAHATAAGKLTIYSIATQEQFLNHEDDRDRGKGNNPFGNFKDATAPTKEAGVGPFAGDRAVFTFRLYRDTAMRRSIGIATFICQYAFDKNAFCNASYQLDGGQLVGQGAFNFSASTFQLSIVGGTGKYRGLTGNMKAAPAPRHTQKLDFVLA